MLFFLPFHLCKMLSIRVRTFLRQAYALPVAICAPMIVVLLLLRRWLVPHSLLQLSFHVLTGGAVYTLGLLWAYLSGAALRVGNLAPLGGRATPEVLTPLVKNYEEEIQFLGDNDIH
jgi:hypothetical protein